jgi:hypothetical protein
MANPHFKKNSILMMPNAGRSSLNGLMCRAILVMAVFFIGYSPWRSYAGSHFSFKSGDVVAFVGGTDVAAANQNGYLESYLSVGAEPMHLRFRNFGWEGDTVYEQPRDFNFPKLTEHLKKAGTTVILMEYGRMESLSFNDSSKRFKAGYQKLLDEFMTITPRIVLITPPPFEDPGGNLPNLARKNEDLRKLVKTIQLIAEERQLMVVDVFKLHAMTEPKRLTSDGLQLTLYGHENIARIIAEDLGFKKAVQLAGNLNSKGEWSNREFETLRQAIVGKNQLWFNYWRPQNWAFLGGDRTEQPSSRDYRNPQVRWFPTEMEKYKPLIEQKEEEIRRLAKSLSK